MDGRVDDRWIDGWDGMGWDGLMNRGMDGWRDRWIDGMDDDTTFFLLLLLFTSPLSLALTHSLTLWMHACMALRVILLLFCLGLVLVLGLMAEWVGSWA
jgi:hypothetical protein